MMILYETDDYAVHADLTPKYIEVTVYRVDGSYRRYEPKFWCKKGYYKPKGFLFFKQRSIREVLLAASHFVLKKQKALSASRMEIAAIQDELRTLKKELEE